MMRVSVSALLLVATASSAMASQGPVVPRPASPPAAPAPLRDREVPIIVQGCIRDNRLQVDDPSDAVHAAIGADEFVMEGPRELLQQLRREHNDHHDEITGVAIIPAVRDDGVGTATKQAGKTRITASSRGGSNQSRIPVVRLKITSLKHIADKCAIGR